ncbi:MAG: sulfotransferase family 2 domain-containing protein [Leptolyngbya sp. SIOISBB]|nr:sulfotransferase family 2 domain-containing protein [Leptolyngbya sp. SIOISBB]
MSNIPYRLIWFQHFHKAAGTSITRLAEANNEVLYENHKNGIPVIPAGNKDVVGGFDPWNFSEKELSEFIDNCEKLGITFLANEWGSVNFELLASDPRVVLITCLRNPLKRFLSNFYFDYWHGYDDISKPENFLGASKFSQTDFYCKFLSQSEQSYKERIDEHHFALAKTNLSLFDYVAVLESDNSIDKLRNFLNWTEELESLQQNKTSRWDRSMIRLLLNGHFDLAFRRISHPRRQPTPEFCDFFMKNNPLDIQLYEFAQKHYP